MSSQIGPTGLHNCEGCRLYKLFRLFGKKPPCAKCIDDIIHKDQALQDMLQRTNKTCQPGSSVSRNSGGPYILLASDPYTAIDTPYFSSGYLKKNNLGWECDVCNEYNHIKAKICYNCNTGNKPAPFAIWQG